ncbi:phage portal protein family protein, partial [Treponema denticola]
DTFAAVISKDAQNLQSTIQSLYDIFCELNWPGEEPVRFEIDAGEYASWEMVTKAIELGVPVSKKALYDRHKLPEPENEEDSFVSDRLIRGEDESSLDFSDNVKKKELLFF